jgi:diadenosine tetraphosphatase ApaH/serine/threonine PP2A family protein phosphatase
VFANAPHLRQLLRVERALTEREQSGTQFLVILWPTNCNVHAWLRQGESVAVFSRWTGFTGRHSRWIEQLPPARIREGHDSRWVDGRKTRKDLPLSPWMNRIVPEMKNADGLFVAHLGHEGAMMCRYPQMLEATPGAQLLDRPKNTL